MKVVRQLAVFFSQSNVTGGYIRVLEYSIKYSNGYSSIKLKLLNSPALIEKTERLRRGRTDGIKDWIEQSLNNRAADDERQYASLFAINGGR